MKVLKIFLVLIISLTMILSFSSICFAEEEPSGDQVIVIDNYDEYEKMLQEDFGDSYYSDYATQYTDTSTDLKDYYNEYRAYLMEYYNAYEKETPTRAIVTEVGQTREEFEATDNYSVSKYILQDIKAKIIEGEHAGEEIKMDYLLSADSLNNIVLAPLHVGDKIYVELYTEDGAVKGEISNSWSTVDRVNIIICLGIIVGILLLLYAGKKGLNTLLIALIAIISCVFIVPLFVHLGISTVWISVFVAVALIVSISFAHLGISKNTFKAICISLAMSAAMMLFVLGMTHVTRTVGTLFEYAAIAENVILGNVDFTALYYMGIFVAGAAVIANLVGASINKIERESADNFQDRVNLCRDILLSSIVNITVLFLVSYIPNHILLLSNKFTEPEILNSETLVAELIRIFAIQLALILAVPLLSLDEFKFGKKYLKEAPKETGDNK